VVSHAGSRLLADVADRTTLTAQLGEVLAGLCRPRARHDLIPGLGKHRLDRLEPEHLEKLWVRMMRNGSAPGTAHQAHRTLRTALNEAVRRGHLVRNPATLAKAPRLVELEVEPYTVDEVRLLLKPGFRS
jgi:integrase